MLMHKRRHIGDTSTMIGTATTAIDLDTGHVAAGSFITSTSITAAGTLDTGGA